MSFLQEGSFAFVPCPAMPLLQVPHGSLTNASLRTWMCHAKTGRMVVSLNCLEINPHGLLRGLASSWKTSLGQEKEGSGHRSRNGGEWNIWAREIWVIFVAQDLPRNTRRTLQLPKQVRPQMWVLTTVHRLLTCGIPGVDFTSSVWRGHFTS